MCGRFAFTGEQWPESIDLQPPEIKPNYNISPQDQVHCISMDNETYKSASMKWGFCPSWVKKSTVEPINARIESASEKPMFRDSFKHRRCLIPATGWYEWKTTPTGKVPFFHRLEDDQPLLFAGIYDTSKDLEQTFCILTTQSHETIFHVHQRMPQIIPESSVDEWLNFGRFTTHQFPIKVYPVDRKVNSTTAEGIELTRPIRTLFD